MTSSTAPQLGLIAGSRSLPLELARHARSTGIERIVAVGFEGETDPALSGLVDEMVWLRVGQLDAMIRAFADRKISRCVMAGQIAPKNLFDLRPDLRAVKLLWKLKEKNAQTIFAAIGDELAKDGVELVDPIPWLKPIMPERGFTLGKSLSDEEQEDVQYGYRLAKEVSRLEIGQTVVVKNGTVLAVEGFEGTDRCLQRGGELAGKEGGAIAVKVAKPGHDVRFDLPCLGAGTIRACAESRVRVLAFEAGRTLLLERPEVEKLVKEARISVVAL